MDMNNTIVSSNNGLSVRSETDSSGALRSGLVGNGRSTTLLGLSFTGRDTVNLGSLSLFNIPDDDLVIISRGDDAVCVKRGKTPGLTIVMRVHDFLAGLLVSNDCESTVTGSDEHGTIFTIDSTDHGAERNGRLASNFFAKAGPDFDVSIFASSVEFVVYKTDG